MATFKVIGRQQKLGNYKHTIYQQILEHLLGYIALGWKFLNFN